MKTRPRRLAGRLVSTLLCLVMCFAMVVAMSPTAYAYDAIDTRTECSISLRYGPEGNRLSGVRFRFYKIADITTGCKLSYVDRFSNYNITLNGLDTEGWRNAAQTLSARVAYDGASYDRSAYTNESGELNVDHLTTGLYLIVGDSISRDGVVYEAMPCLMVLPYLQDNEWLYDTQVTPKYTTHLEELTSRRVIKVWDDAGHGNERPASIQVALLRDGRVYDTVTLGAYNNWGYTWPELEDRYVWQLVELGNDENYTVSTYRNGLTFVVTNTYLEEIPEDPTPLVPGRPDPPEPWLIIPPEPVPTVPAEEPPIDIPEEPVPQAPWVTPKEPDKTPEKPEDPEYVDIPDEDVPLGPLPQTGQLWWPVPILVIAGLVCLIVSAIRRRDDE